MYVIRNKKTKEILLMVNSEPGVERDAKDLYPEFDRRTMEFGVSEEQVVPAGFTIQKGRVRPAAATKEDSSAGEEPAVAVPRLTEQKALVIETLSQLAFDERRKLVPDYQLQNAALGIYDEAQTSAIRNTVQAFRDEFYRLKAEVEKARSARSLQKVKAQFPTTLRAAKATADASKQSEKK